MNLGSSIIDVIRSFCSSNKTDDDLNFFWIPDKRKIEETFVPYIKQTFGKAVFNETQVELEKQIIDDISKFNNTLNAIDNNDCNDKQDWTYLECIAIENCLTKLRKNLKILSDSSTKNSYVNMEEQMNQLKEQLQIQSRTISRMTSVLSIACQLSSNSREQITIPMISEVVGGPFMFIPTPILSKLASSNITIVSKVRASIKNKYSGYYFKQIISSTLGRDKESSVANFFNPCKGWSNCGAYCSVHLSEGFSKVKYILQAEKRLKEGKFKDAMNIYTENLKLPTYLPLIRPLDDLIAKL